MDKKLIFIDLDGTLTPHSTWYELNMKLGITPEEDQALFGRYLKDDLPYNAWTAELVRLHKEHDPVQQAEIVAFAETINLRPDAESFISELKEKGYHTVLISGSIDTIVETIARKLGFDAWLACTKAVYDAQGVFSDFISSGDEGPAKVDLSQNYCVTNNFDLSQAFVVGDGGNELDLFKLAKGILIGNNEKLKPLAWKQVESLSEIPALL
jgi:HAD superfamily phosphoserine phosphatase-like hydrolase